MGEYAIRKKDRQEIKIGSCESMYYCRYEQLNEIEYPHPTENCIWRIPVPSEDGYEPGNFPYGYKTAHGYIMCQLLLDEDNIPCKDTIAQDEGLVQARVEDLGLIINVTCNHGLRLPESTPSAKFFWNGKRNPLYLSGLKNTEKELKVVISCSACGSAWSCSFNEIEPAIIDMEMKLRLLHQCSEYYLLHNDGYSAPYRVTAKNQRGEDIVIEQTERDEYAVITAGSDTPIYGTWENARNLFISELPDEEQGRYLKDKYLPTIK